MNNASDYGFSIAGQIGGSENSIENMRLERLTNGYIETALWCGVEYPMGDPRSDSDKDYTKTIDDLAEETLKTMQEDCLQFFTKYYDLLSGLCDDETIRCGPDFDFWGHIGHDFWLTRNHHGAGFWDGDYPEPFADLVELLL